MSFSHALFHVIAIAAILHSAWVIATESWPKPRNRRVRISPHHSARRNGTQAVP